MKHAHPHLCTQVCTHGRTRAYTHILAYTDPLPGAPATTQAIKGVGQVDKEEGSQTEGKEVGLSRNSTNRSKAYQAGTPLADALQQLLEDDAGQGSSAEEGSVQRGEGEGRFVLKASAVPPLFASPHTHIHTQMQMQILTHIHTQLQNSLVTEEYG